MKASKLILFISLKSCFSLYVYPQQAVVVDTYTTQDFKNSRQHWATVQADDGTLIFGNSNAINSFDGVTWKYIHVPKGQTVYSLDKSTNGTIYTGGEGDIGYLFPDDLNRMSFRSLLSKLDSTYHDFLYVRQTHYLDNKVYFRSANQMMMYDIGKDSVFAFRPEYSIGNSYKVNGKILVQLINKGLFELTNLELIEINSDFEYSSDDIYGILNYQSDLLIYFRNKGLQIFDGKKLDAFSFVFDDYLVMHKGYRMIKINESLYAIATLTGGIVFFDNNGELIQILNKDKGLNDNSVYNLFIDDSKKLWAVLDDGVSLIEIRDNFNIYDSKYGVEGLVQDIFDVDSLIYVASNKGVFLSKKDVIEFSKIANTPDQSYSTVKIKDAILNATFDGLFSIKENESNKLSKLKFEKLLNINDSIVLGWHDKYLYEIQHSNGMGFNTKRLAEFPKPKDWLIHREHIIILSVEGEIWTFNLDSLKLNRLPTELELGNLYSLTSFDEYVYIGSKAGIYNIEIKEKSVYKVPYFNKNESTTLLKLCANTIWARIGAKLFKYEQINGEWRYEHQKFNDIGNKEGVYGISCAEKKIWIGLEDKIISIREDYKNTPNSFKTIISRFSTGNDSLIYDGFGDQISTPTLKYSRNKIRFNYAAAFFYKPEFNTYQYKLDGFDEKWSSWSPETQKDYTNIPEGEYTFRVRSRNVYEYEGIPDEITFTILPPWYRTWWAYMLYVIVIAGILYGIYKIRINQILKIQGVRNRIADDLHDDLSGTLIGISNFAKAITKNPNKETQERFIGLIGKSADEAKEKISDIVWTINPTHDEWTNFLTKCRRHASDILEAQGIDYSLEMDESIPGNLDMELRKNLWLIFKEIITNITKHSEADYVLISFKTHSNRLHIKIRDNGTGFDIKAIESGNGIQSITKRVEAIKGTVNLESEIGEGTKWEIDVPL